MTRPPCCREGRNLLGGQLEIVHHAVGRRAQQKPPTAGTDREPSAAARQQQGRPRRLRRRRVRRVFQKRGELGGGERRLAGFVGRAAAESTVRAGGDLEGQFRGESAFDDVEGFIADAEEESARGGVAVVNQAIDRDELGAVGGDPGGSRVDTDGGAVATHGKRYLLSVVAAD